MEREKNMTTGRPLRLIVTFAVPLMIGGIGQQLYTLVDSAVVGRGVGVADLAAVGATDWTYWVFLWGILGLAQGFSIPIAQEFGKGDKARVKKAVAMSLLLSAALSILLTLLGLAARGPVLRLLKTPEDIFDSAVAYITVLFIGLSAVMAYNMASSILRAFGDGRTPLIAMVVASAMNILLDLLFVLVFRWGVAGAAVATVIAQVLAFLYCALILSKSQWLALTKEDWKPDAPMLRWLWKTGATMAATQILIAIGGMVLQSAINAQGSVFLAGVTAVNKLIGLLESSAIALGSAVTTYIAQNFGAGEYGRLRKGLKVSLVVGVLLSLAISAVMILAGRLILSMFIDPGDPNAGTVLDIAYHYLFIMSVLLSSLYVLHVCRKSVLGMGCNMGTVVSGLLEFFARSSVAVFFCRVWGMETLYFAEPFAWCASTVSLIFMVIWQVRRLPG